MRKIKEGETALVRLALSRDLGLTNPRFFVKEEEVEVPHSTVFQTTIQGKEVVFTYIKFLEPQRRVMTTAMITDLFEAPAYFGHGKASKFNKNQVVAVRVP